jgi:hypothetical protein
MHNEPEIIGELWEVEPVETKLHSRLYHLEPVGIGSSLVESLTSYITRLANAHSVQPHALVRDEIIPLLNRSYLYRDGRPVHGNLSAFWKQSAVLNGITTLTSNWVEVLEWLTMRTDLRFLTMLFWNDVLPPRGLVRRVRAWCPVCYEEWRGAAQVVYEPLLWSLEVVGICPRHGQLLEQCCPNPACARIQFPLPSQCQPGYCAWCHRWLGNLPLHNGHNSVTPTSKELEWQRWVVNAVGELLAAAPSLPVKPGREAIATTIVAYVDGVMGGNELALARQLQRSYYTVREWQQGQQIPQLGNLVQICSHFGISPLCLLTGKAGEVAMIQKTARGGNPISDRPKRRFRAFPIESLRHALEEVLRNAEIPPPPMREVAERLEYDPSHLSKHFPELCRAISKRYLDYQAEKREERLQRICDEVRQAVLTLHAQGHYPSMKQVQKLLSQPAVLMEYKVRAAWHDALRELGVEAMKNSLLARG